MNRNATIHSRESHKGHYVTPDQLRVGMYIHLDLGWLEHPFAFGSFKIKNEEQIRQIRELNLKRIRFDPLRSDVLPDFPETVQIERPKPVASPPASTMHVPQRSMRLKQLNEAILESERTYGKQAPLARMAVTTLADHPDHAKKLGTHVVKEMVNSIITESDVALHAIGSAQEKQTGFHHPLNVTVLALMLAKALDMKAEDASLLGLAALFHDAGKEDMPSGKSFVDLHCEVGARLVLQAGLPERMSKIVMQHHEYMDGTGFPMRLKSEQIDPLGRILSLVNHFDELCNPANPAEALTPYEALSLMYTSQSEKFDPALLRLFIRMLGVYPPGSIVQLSNGMYGIVLAENPAKPMLPIVMVYVREVARETPVVIDLAQEHALTVQKCLRPAHLPIDAYEYLKPAKRTSFYFLNQESAHDDGKNVKDHGQDDPEQPYQLRRA
jgi:putative nucleotidyltransferase with HDIG domain